MKLNEFIAKLLFRKVIDKEKKLISDQYELKSYAVSQASGDAIERALRQLMGYETEPELIINYMVFVCLTYTIEEVAKIKLNAYKNDEIAKNSEIQTKLEFLNPLYSSQGEFIGHIVLSLIYKGIAYILNDKKYFIVIKPEELSDIILDKDTGIHLSYKYKDKTYTDKDLIIIKFINNPSDITKPYSVFDAIENIASLTNKGVVFLRNFFEEGGFLPGFFKSTSQIEGMGTSIEKYDYVKEEQLFKRVMQRVKKGKAGILPPNYDFITAGSSPKDSITIDIMSHIENIIATAFNIPKSIIGKLTSGGSYSLTNAERKLFYDIVIDKYINKIESAFTLYCKRFINQNIEVKRDVSRLSYLKVYMLDYATPIAQLVGGGVLTPNEARKRFFELEEVPEGAVLRNTEKVKIDGNSQEGDRGNPKQEGDEKKNEKMQKSTDSENIEELVKVYRAKIEKILDPLIRDLTIELKDLFILFKNTINVDIKDKEKKVNEYNILEIIFMLINTEKVNEIMSKFENIILKYYKTAIRRANRILSEIYEDFERIENPEKEFADWIDNQVKISKRLFYEDNILLLIYSIYNLNNNITIEELINKIFEGIESFYKVKPKLWAVTEMMKTINEYFYTVAKAKANEGKIIYKAWRSMRDEKVRIPHRIVDNDVWIPLDKKFLLITDTGTYLADRPYDPALPPELVINCRCFLMLKNI